MRSAGTGTKETLPSGRTRIRVTIADGTRPSLGTFDTDEEASAVLDAAIAQLAKSPAAATGALTLCTWGTEWLDARELDGMRSIKPARRVWRAHIVKAPFYGWPLGNIARRDVKDWIRKVRRGRAMSTAKNALNLLRACYRDAIDDERFDGANPCIDVSPPELATDGVDEDEANWAELALKPADQAKLIAACPEPEREIVRFAIGAMLREGEQWCLELRDIHMNDQEPWLLVRFGKPGQRPKNGKTRRVPLFGMALDALRRWLAILPGYAVRKVGRGKLKRIEPYNPLGLVFPTRRGCRRAMEKPPRHFAEWVEAAKLDRHVVWHHLRHTGATGLLSGWYGRKWSLEEVSKILGHQSLEITQRYAKFADDALQEAATATDLALADASTERPRLARVSRELLEILESHPRDLNPRPAVYEASEEPPPGHALASRMDAPWALQVHATELLQAIRRRDSAAHTMAVDLAVSRLCDSADAQAALRVLAGGAHVLDRAMELAAAVLDAAPAAAKAATGGAS